MQPNPYEAPQAENLPEDQSTPSEVPTTPSLLARLTSVPLVVVVMVMIFPLLIARIESDGELIYILFLDIVVGAALFGAIALNFPSRRRFMNVGTVVGACFAILFMGWHLNQIYMRKYVAREMMERMRERPSDMP